MSITDELRKYISGPARWGISHICEENIVAIADRIDAEYEKNMVDALLNDGLPMSDEVMAEHGWYRVLDADKQPIHIGDELDSDHCEDGTVVGLQFFEEANGVLRVFIAIRPHGWDTPTWCVPDSFHHHEPTVEDVLREFGERYCDTVDGCAEESELFAEYAAKLQLRGDGE